MKRCQALFFGLFFVVLFSGPAAGDEYHYNNVLIGDRATGMGGAYTAVSDDATGLYYNPAGIVYATGKNLSASVNAFYHLAKTYEGVIGGKDWERTSSALLPNYFGIVQPLGSGVRFGFSYAVPDTSNEDQDQVFGLSGNSTYIINFNNDDNTYNFGPSLAAEITGNFSAGVTLYLHKRNAQMILNQIVDTPSGAEWTNKYFELNEWGVRPLIGLAWSPVDKLSLGLSVSKTFVLSSRSTDQVTCSDPAAIGTDCPGVDLITSKKPDDTKRKYPSRITLGAAYFASSRFLLSGDLTYYTKVPADRIFGSKVSVLNAALGTEYYLNKTWAIRGGVFTNMANTPEIKAGVPSSEEHIDLYGGSLSLSHFTRNTSVTLGGSIVSGTGESQLVGTSVQDASALGWTISLSSSYSY